jgi:hypothetical protein
MDALLFGKKGKRSSGGSNRISSFEAGKLV